MPSTTAAAIERLKPVLLWEELTFRIRSGTSWLVVEDEDTALRLRGAADLATIAELLKIHQESSGACQLVRGAPGAGRIVLARSSTALGDSTSLTVVGQGELLLSTTSLTDLQNWLALATGTPACANPFDRRSGVHATAGGLVVCDGNGDNASYPMTRRQADRLCRMLLAGAMTQATEPLVLDPDGDHMQPMLRPVWPERYQLVLSGASFCDINLTKGSLVALAADVSEHLTGGR